MRIKLILFLLAVIFSCGCAHDQNAAQLFGNMVYIVDNPVERKKDQRVTLINGVYERLFLNVTYGDKYVYGDFNHDGLKDAAVVIFENHGGNAEYGELAFLINDGGQLIHQSSLGLGGGIIVNSLREKNGKVIVDMFVHQEGDCHAGPSKRVRHVYEYPGPQFSKGRA